jgi:hypothetical protein
LWSVSAFGAELGVETRLWENKLDADVSVDQGTIPGTDIDLDADLNLDDDETSTEYRLWTRLGNWTLTGSYLTLENDGSQRLAKSVTYKGITYGVNDTVTADMEVELGDLTVQHPLPFLHAAGISLDWLFGVKYVGFDGELQSNLAGTRSESVEAPLPEIGAALAMDWDWFRLFAGAKGLAVDYSDVSGSMFDAEGGVGFKWKSLMLTGGYRIFQIDINADKADLDLSYSGPFGGLAWVF